MALSKEFESNYPVSIVTGKGGENREICYKIFRYNTYLSVYNFIMHAFLLLKLVFA